MKKYILLFLFLLFLSVITFFNLWHTYFQQDEWYWFGKVIYSQKAGLWTLMQTNGFHFIPLSAFIIVELFKLFHLQFVFYILFSLILHSANALLVFIICQRMTKNSVTALLASILFLVANASQQAVTWVGASFSILPATFFGLLSLLLFLEYMHKGNKKRFLVFTLASLFIGLMCKEDIVFLFLFYPVYAFVYQKKYFLRVFILMSIVGALYVGSRYVLQFSSPQAMALGQGTSLSGIVSVIVRAGLIPFQAFSMLYVTPGVALVIAHGILDRYRTALETMISMKAFGNNFGLFVEQVGVAMVSTVFTLIMVTAFWITTISARKTKEVKRLYIMFLFIILSVLSYGLLPKQLGMESRHYYFPMVGASLVAALYINYIFAKLRNIRLRVAVVFLIIGYVGMNVYLNHQSIHQLIDVSKSRRRFVSQIEGLYKALPPKTMMISSGDQPNVQSGVGEMLLVIFHDRYPSYKFLGGFFLWDYESQGYTQSGDHGFGYFSDYQKMKNSYSLFHLAPENVFSFAWDTTEEKLIDATRAIRRELTDARNN